MVRNASLFFIKRFILVVATAIGYVAIMLVITVFAVFRGLWVQSDLVTNAWRNRLPFAGMDGHFRGPMYWALRLIALMLMLASLVVLAEGLSRLFEWTLRL